MLKAVKQFFSDHMQIAQEREEPTARHSINVAAAALLIEVGRADFSFSDAEEKRVADLLHQQLHIGEAELAELIALARRESLTTTSLHGFTRLIHDSYSASEKCQLMEKLWGVAFADGRLDRYEEHILRKIADLLYLPHRDFIQAKLRALGES